MDRTVYLEADQTAFRLDSLSELDSYQTREFQETGWYCDDFYDRVIYPRVFRLTHSRGFIVGYTVDESEGFIVNLEVVADLSDAMRSAQSLAEHAAELEREYSEGFTVACQITDELIPEWQDLTDQLSQLDAESDNSDPTMDPQLADDDSRAIEDLEEAIGKLERKISDLIPSYPCQFRQAIADNADVETLKKITGRTL